MRSANLPTAPFFCELRADKKKEQRTPDETKKETKIQNTTRTIITESDILSRLSLGTVQSNLFLNNSLYVT